MTTLLEHSEAQLTQRKFVHFCQKQIDPTKHFCNLSFAKLIMKRQTSPTFDCFKVNSLFEISLFILKITFS